MNADLLKAWLKRKKARGFVQYELLAALALVGGLVILFLTFWFTYAIVWTAGWAISSGAELVTNKPLHISHAIRLACSGIFIVLLFIQHFRTNPLYWGDYPQDHYRSSPYLQMQAGLIGGLGVMLAYPGASANMVADILLTGPRLVTGSFGLVKEGLRWNKLDENGCGELLFFLFSRQQLVPYEDLKSAGWDAWFDQLRGIEGVQFLQKGVVLSGELRTELGQIPFSNE